MEKWVETELKELMWTTILFFIMVGIVPIASLFLFGGAESVESIDKSNFYWGIGSISMIYILTMTIIQMFLKKKHFIGNVVLNDPEYSGILTDKNGKPYISFKGLLYISILLFSTISFFATLQNTLFLVSIPSAEFQVTETGNILLSTEPASFVETILFIPIISLLLTFSYIKFYLKKKKGLHYAMVFGIIPFIIGLGWIALHYYRYGSSEGSLTSVFLFGYFGSLLTCITGSPAFWWIWHFFNNMYQKMNVILQENTILIITILIWSITAIVWISDWVKKEKEKHEN